MLEAAAWGLVAASSLLLGALVAFSPPLLGWLTARHEWRLGLLMAFGSGVLISAVAYDLVEEATAVAVTGFDVGIGFALGAVTFFVGDELLDRWASGSTSGGDDDGRSGLAILLGAVLDGIPESVVIGLTLLSGNGIGIAVVVAVFLSNVPEAISATAGLVRRYPRANVLAGWLVVVVVSAVAAGLGYALLGGAPGGLVAALQAFAGGAILVMLADEMIPGAFTRGHTPAGLATALGFGVAAVLSFNT